MKENLKINLLVFALLMVLIAHAQNEKEKDFDLWLGIRASKNFKKNVKTSLELQTRLVEYDQTNADIGAVYQALGFLNIGSEIRFKFLKGGDLEYRLSPFLSVETGKRDFDMEFQFKYQNTLSRFDYPKSVFRNKLIAKYSIKKDWRLSSSIELFLGKKKEVYWADRFRWSLACRYKINKKHYITLGYALERQNAFDEDDEILQRHLLSIRYDLKWK